MKLLFDLFPVILFFATFKLSEHFSADALALAQSVMGEGVTPMTAPVFLATIVAILATFCQIGWLKIKGRRVETMLWISLAVIVVFGGLTLWLKNEMFIKWKPTILYWVFGSILVYGNFAGRNFMRALMKSQIDRCLGRLHAFRPYRIDNDFYNWRCLLHDEARGRAAELKDLYSANHSVGPAAVLRTANSVNQPNVFSEA